MKREDVSAENSGLNSLNMDGQHLKQALAVEGEHDAHFETKHQEFPQSDEEAWESFLASLETLKIKGMDWNHYTQSDI